MSASLFAGPTCAILVFLGLPSSYSGNGDGVFLMDEGIRVVFAVTVWMAIWWITEAVPMSVTALLPVTVFPILGVLPLSTAAEPYAHPLIFLFFAGFLVSIALQKWSLHRRFAISLLRRVGDNPTRVVGGFMLATACLSMWLSNTAATIMMLPIALSIIGRHQTDRGFEKCLLLSLAYSASIGGMATIVGTPPNLYVASYFNDILGVQIGFVDWMMIGVPCVSLLLPLAWWYLTRIHFSLPPRIKSDAGALSGDGLVWSELQRGGRATLLVFGLLVCVWMARPWLVDIRILGFAPLSNLTDTSVALVAAVALFLIPVDLSRRKFVLDWPDARELPWGTLILFGGGLSLANTINATGADKIIGFWVSNLSPVSTVLMITALVAIVVLLTEFTSNVATTATLVPILAAATPVLGLKQEIVIIIVALAASCAFMLPVATPPNAIVFGSGRIRASEMAWAGAAMNFLGLIVISVIAVNLIPTVLDFSR